MSPVRRRIDEARLALMFLTRVPVGRLSDPAPTLAEARWAFPLVGVLTGAVAWAGQHGALALGMPPLVAGLAALGTIALLTGALHHDGLADFADGIGGGRDRAHCLDIMRDSRIGSYGVLALIFAVALGAAALALPDGAPLAVFLMAGVGSRLAMLATLDLLPPARDDGLGHMASRPNVAAWAPGIVILALLGLFDPHLWLSLPVIAAVAALIAWRAKRRIGGQTGDVLGAVQVTGETVGWVALVGLF